MYAITRNNFEILTALVNLAKERNPVQGIFYFGSFNFTLGKVKIEAKEEVNYCGTSGCLAGGYLPLLYPERFKFDKDGHFIEVEENATPDFAYGRFCHELGDDLRHALFYGGNTGVFFDKRYYKGKLGLVELFDTATRLEVIQNAMIILAALKVMDASWEDVQAFNYNPF